MSQSNNSSDRASIKNSNTFESKLSFALALITLLLIFGYFVQSFISIHQQKIIVVAMERIESKVVEANKQQQTELNHRGY